MRIKFLRRGQAIGAAVLFALGCAFIGAAVDRLCLHLGMLEPPAAVEALAQSVIPLEQTPVIKTVDFGVSPEGGSQPAMNQAEYQGLQVEVVRSSQAAKSKGKILIYHTHTYEAYRQIAADRYQETEKWRTKDERHNVVRVGSELARLLIAKGYEVVHDTKAYEPPNLSTSYSRSLDMLERRSAQGETYDLYIDLHRDAYTASMAGNNAVQVGDQALAKLMVLIGKGTGQTGAGFDIRPEWEKNYAIAQQLTANLNEQVEGLCRKISLKTGRFNQHIAPCCILVEAGNNENTVTEVLASMPYLADAIDETLALSSSEKPAGT